MTVANIPSSRASEEETEPQTGLRHPPATPAERKFVLQFFRFYAKCKDFLNYLRGRPGRNA
jgi:hypothetical protein